MEDVVIVSGVRTPIGKFQGAYSNLSASDLGAIAIRAAVERAGLKPEQVDHVIFGCVGQVAEDGYISRHAAVKAGMPIETPALSVNRVCGSGLEAINTAARYIQCGDATVVVAGGTENMTMAPYYLRNARAGYRMGNGVLEDGILHLLGDPFSKTHMGITAENLAEKYEVSRAVQDEISMRSQERAAAAIAAGKFVDEIVPVEVKQGKETVTISQDEHPRQTTLEALGKLKPAFKPDGMVTAGNASGINDGAAALVVMTESKAKELGVKPRLRLVARAEAGVEPSTYGERADPGGPEGAREGEADDRPDRPGGAERGVRLGGGGVQRGAAARPGEGERERRRHRAGAPAGRDGRDPDGEADARDGAAGLAVRAGEPVHRRRAGDREHLRAGVGGC